MRDVPLSTRWKELYGNCRIIMSDFVGLNVPTFDLLLSKQATIVYIGR